MGARLLGFAFGFLVVLAICVGLGRALLAPPTVLSECDGSIKTLAIQFTRESAGRLWPTIQAFLRQTDPSIEVIAVCGNQEDEAAFLKLRKQIPQRHVETVVVGAEITGWSKDRFLVAGRNLLTPRAAPSVLAGRSNDARVAPAIALRFPGRFRAVDTRLDFDAGDVVCSRSFAFYSRELEGKNPGIKDLRGALAETTGKKPVFITGAPGHHVGTFAAPIDDGTLIVGDPDLGKGLWTDGGTRALGVPDWSEAATQPFRNAITALGSSGFRVLRVPTAYLGPKVYLTYTNAVIDNRGGRRIAFMPEYGVTELDDASARVYREAGFEVRSVPVRGVFRLCGTIGCLVNVLERE